MTKLRRVTLYRETIDVHSMYSVYDSNRIGQGRDEDSMKTVFTHFSNTPEAKWIRAQTGVYLHHSVDDQTYAYAREIKIYADLDTKQYTEYVLRGLSML